MQVTFDLTGRTMMMMMSDAKLAVRNHQNDKS